MRYGGVLYAVTAQQTPKSETGFSASVRHSCPALRAIGIVLKEHVEGKSRTFGLAERPVDFGTPVLRIGKFARIGDVTFPRSAVTLFPLRCYPGAEGLIGFGQLPEREPGETENGLLQTDCG